jgi:hypothetical protein
MPIRKKRQPEQSTILTTRQAMYVQRYTEARSCNYCCSGKAKCITGSVVCVCVCVLFFGWGGGRSLTLLAREAYAPFYILKCGLPSSISSKNSVWNISHSNKN